ncbi:MAG: hypothetical protein Q7S57_05710 [bacterium]|nr:hypothetical protein [bacterium]
MLLKHRTVKQIVIACIFFGFWISLGGLIYWATYTPPDALPPPPKTALPLQVIATKIIATTPGKGDLVGTLRNPNPNAGAVRFKYKFTISATNQNPQVVTGESFVLPSDQKYLTAFNNDIPTGATASLEISSTEWAFVDSGFAPPEIVLINKPTNIISGPTIDTFQLKGLLANQSNVDYTRVEVTVVGLDAQGEMIGVSKTFMGSFLSAERREFTAQWPLNKGEIVSDFKVVPEVNVFLPDAIQRRQGIQDIRDLQSVATPAGN